HACAATAVLLQPPGQQQAYRQHDQAGAKDQEETSDQIGLHLENSLQSGSPGSCAKSSSPSVICSFIQVCAVAAGCNPSGAIMPRPGCGPWGEGAVGALACALAWGRADPEHGLHPRSAEFPGKHRFPFSIPFRTTLTSQWRQRGTRMPGTYGYADPLFLLIAALALESYIGRVGWLARPFAGPRAWLVQHARSLELRLNRAERHPADRRWRGWLVVLVLLF